MSPAANTTLERIVKTKPAQQTPLFSITTPVIRIAKERPITMLTKIMTNIAHFLLILRGGHVKIDLSQEES